MTSPGNTTSDGRPGPNGQLIGQDDARRRLNTPALIVDLDVLEANIRKMANYARKANYSLRPHIKSHKSVAIARLQIEAGAIGLSCANIGEAEVMGLAGLTDLLITSPLGTREKIDRFCTLARRCPDLKVVVDSLENVQALSHAGTAANVVLKVLVDIDPGMERTGVSGSTQVVELARAIRQLPNLEFMGIQSYAGHLQHIDCRKKRTRKSLKALQEAAEIRDSLVSAGLAPTIISGGGTGTYDIDGQQRVLTELQPGSYIFMDVEYNNIWLNDGEPPPFETALFFQAAVISANYPGFVTTDGGFKHFTGESDDDPVPVRGAPEGSRYVGAGDEYGQLKLPGNSDRLSPGTRIECVVPHCDPTVNLYNVIHCFRGDKLVAIWPIEARGA